jgi:hypothetical protein
VDDKVPSQNVGARAAQLNSLGGPVTLEYHESVLRNLSKTKAVLAFLFRKCAFIRMSTEHDVAQSILSADDLRRSYVEGKYKPNVEFTADLARERTVELRRSLRQAFTWVLCSALASSGIGLLLQWWLGICAQWLSSLLQLTAVAVILGATIWELGWGIRSMEGITLPERMHQWVFRLMYVVGSSLFFVAYVWGTRWAA